MLMLVSGRVARQGSYRMVISMKLAYNKKADYLGPTRFLSFPVPTTNLDSYICLCISFWSAAWRQYCVIKKISVIFYVGLFSYNG